MPQPLGPVERGAAQVETPSAREEAPTAAAPSPLLQRKLRERALQRRQAGGEREGADAAGMHQLAADGQRGAGGALPHGEAIQRSFGRHDVGGIVAHSDGAAQQAAQAMGAEAYAYGDHVAFDGAPSLHTAAHEAAHVVQQRGGVHLKGGVGAEGDEHERHADAVADRVVRGESAEGLLDRYAPTGGAAGGHALQHKLAFDAKTRWLDRNHNAKLSQFGVLVDMETKVDAALGDDLAIAVVEERVAGGAAAFQPGLKRVAIQPMPEAPEEKQQDKAAEKAKASDPRESLTGLDVSDRIIALSHELQHVFDAYDAKGSFDMREALQNPSQDQWQQLVRSEWHAHARQAKAAKEQVDQERGVPSRHKMLLRAWTTKTFDRAEAGSADSMFKWTRDYITRYKYQDKKQTQDDEVEKFIQSKASWVEEAFAILPPQK